MWHYDKEVLQEVHKKMNNKEKNKKIEVGI
jgi:hypothetical protein